MTTPATGSGRPPAIHPRLTSRCFRLCCAALLALSTAGAWAQDATIAPDNPDANAAALPFPQASKALSFHSPMLLPQRTLLFARDLNSLFNSEQVQSSPSDAAGNTASGDGRTQSLLKRALALLGTPYRWGGTSPESGFDCSGLVAYVFRNTLGIELPRISRDMANVGQLIRDRNALAEGDLVFFSRSGKRVDHVGIYMGDGKFVHAPRTGKDVEVANLATGYWSQKFLQARRVTGL